MPAAPSGGGTREAQPQLQPGVSCSSRRAAGEQLGGHFRSDARKRRALAFKKADSKLISKKSLAFKSGGELFPLAEIRSKFS